MKTTMNRTPLALAVALAIYAGTPALDQLLSDSGLALGGQAQAASQSGHSGGQGGQGGQGQGGPRHQGGRSAVSVTSEDGDDSDKRGPKYMGGENSNKPGDGDRGGKPAWAQEGIPEDVELGRLNVARAPDHVLERQFYEALNTWNPDMEAFYEMTAEAAADLLKTDYDNVLRYDSPLMNLALYKDLVVDNITQLPGVTPASVNDLAAILLGSASDKTISITEGTVNAINLVLDLGMTEADVATVAAKAELVRDAIYTGHE